MVAAVEASAIDLGRPFELAPSTTVACTPGVRTWLIHCGLLASLVASTAACRLPTPADTDAGAIPAVMPPELPSVPREGDEVLGFVALAGDAALYSTPALAGRISAMNPSPGTAVVWRVVATTDAFVAVESLPWAELARQCVEHDRRVEAVFDLYHLRAHVRRDELSEVVPTPTQVEFSDGSRLMLGAGLPITFVGEQARFEGHGLAINVPLTHDQLGVSWVQPGHQEPQPPGLPTHGEPTGLSLDGAPYEPMGMPSSLGLAVDYQAIDESRGRWTFMNDCVRVNPVGPPPEYDSWLGLVGKGGGGGTAEGWFGGSYWVIPASTPARWPDGSEAGESLEDQRLPELTGRIVDDLVCFDLWADLDICHERSAITLDSE